MKGEHCLPNDLNFCLNHSECDGKSYLCPDRKPLPDYTLCGDEHLDGVCHNGHCQMCSRYIEGCHFCCLEKFKKTCKPNRILPVDSKCEIKNMPGRCDYQGICQNLNSIIDTFKPSTIGPSPHPIDKFNFILSIRGKIVYQIFFKRKIFHVSNFEFFSFSPIYRYHLVDYFYYGFHSYCISNIG